jgi:hypothetical protein
MMSIFCRMPVPFSRPPLRDTTLPARRVKADAGVIQVYADRSHWGSQVALIRSKSLATHHQHAQVQCQIAAKDMRHRGRA